MTDDDVRTTTAVAANSRMLTLGEVAHRLRVSERTARRYLERKLIPFTRISGRVLVPETALEQLLRATT